MRTEVKNRVLMLGQEITAEVKASAPGRRAWMSIRPAEEGNVMLVEFEHDARLDTDGWFAPEDVLDRRRTDFASLDEVIEALERRGIVTDSFDAPWKMDYPL
jgi:hypothetical protein